MTGFWEKPTYSVTILLNIQVRLHTIALHGTLDWSLISCLRETASSPRAAMAQSIATNSTTRTAKGSRLRNGLTATTGVVMIAFAISMPRIACIEKCHHLCPVGFVKGLMLVVEARSMLCQWSHHSAKPVNANRCWGKRK